MSLSARIGAPAPWSIQAVRAAAEGVKDAEAAQAAGYGLFHGCVSGPQEGAIGLHFATGNLVGVDASLPEALIYDWRNGRLHLLGVEYLVLAEAWDAASEAPPMLMGQVFHYVGAPNRYRLPAFYELHVWPWKRNPSGTFADWNPRVACDDYAPEGATHASGH